jgi:hypothetical protein
MRVLYSLFALVAAASGVSAAVTGATYQFPFTNIVVTPTVQPGAIGLGTQNNGAGALVPKFSAYSQSSLRYSYELQYAGGPIDFALAITQNTLNSNSNCQAGTGSTTTSNLQLPSCTSAAFRLCTGYLSNAAASSAYSVCPYSKYTVATSSSGNIAYVAQAVLGTQVVEVQTFNYQLNSQVSTATPVSYLISLSVIDYTSSGLGGLTGVQMWSLDSDYGTGITPPFSTANSAYKLSFYAQNTFIPGGAATTKSITVPSNPNVISGTTYNGVALSYMPYYIVTQSSVDTVFVQECTGIPCNLCNIDGQPKLVLAGTVPINSQTSAKFGEVPGAQKDINAVFPSYQTQQTSNIFTKHGRYYFPFVPTNGQSGITGNCVRFINRAQGVVNDNTITIDVAGYICNLYKTCTACVDSGFNHATTGCGWCLTDNFNANIAGTCLVGRTGAQNIVGTPYYYYDQSTSLVDGQVCLKQSGLNIPNGQPGRFVSYYLECVVLIRGDPRISGLQGQDFQVHGTPNEYFNLVSSPTLQVNSRFVYLDDAKCDNFTTCFSHPGTYIDEIGVMMGENKIRIAAGAINEAARVFVNGKEVKVSAHKHSAGSVSVTFANARRVVVKTPEFMMTISQSDKFFNVDSALLKTELLDQGSKLVKLAASRATEENKMMHGLIGQTWRNNVYAGDREYEGEVSDYQVADGIWGKDFAFNLYL